MQCQVVPVSLAIVDQIRRPLWHCLRDSLRVAGRSTKPNPEPDTDPGESRRYVQGISIS